MGAGFAFVEAAFAALPADVGVIVGDLGEAVGFGQVIDAAVADVTEVHPFGGEPAQAEGGAHAGAFFVALAEFDHLGVDGGEHFGEDIGKIAAEAAGAHAEAAWEEVSDFFDGDLAGEFAGFGAAHAVADGENEIHRGERRFADFSEVVDVVPVEGECEKGVFVVVADTATVGHAGPDKLVGGVRLVF